ncbi:MAG: CHASE2 domain-containing protein, partial [Pseudomonadota bacterium]
FADLLYTFERGAEGGLDQLMSRLATDGARTTGAAEAGVSRTGMVFSVVGDAVEWTSRETRPEVLTRFDLGIVGFEEPDALGERYPLMGAFKAAGGGPGFDGARAPTAAYKLFQLTCEIEAQRSGPPRYDGCRTAAALAARTEAGQVEIAVRWGNLNQGVWEPLGFLVDAPEEELRAIRAALGVPPEKRDAEQTALVARGKGCRVFGSDFDARVQETAAQAIASFEMWRTDDLVIECPYALTIPARQLISNTPEMRDYLSQAIGGKIVLIGQSVIGASDRVATLDTKAPGVYAHAMALDNLLLYGNDHLRPPEPVTELFGRAEIAGVGVADLGLKRNVLLELATLATILISYLLLAPATSRFLRRVLPIRFLSALVFTLFWAVIAVGVSAGFLWFSYAVLRWPPHDWVMAVVYAGITAKIVARLDAGDAADAGDAGAA